MDGLPNLKGWFSMAMLNNQMVMTGTSLQQHHSWMMCGVQYRVTSCNIIKQQELWVEMWCYGGFSFRAACRLHSDWVSLRGGVSLGTFCAFWWLGWLGWSICDPFECRKACSMTWNMRMSWVAYLQSGIKESRFRTKLDKLDQAALMFHRLL